MGSQAARCRVRRYKGEFKEVDLADRTLTTI
jgi:hypothetical protein